MENELSLLNNKKQIQKENNKLDVTKTDDEDPNHHNKRVLIQKTQTQDATELWQEAHTKKRPRESLENIRTNLKQTKLNSYWLSAPVTISNRFSVLDMDEPASEATTHEASAQEHKPPPLFIDDVTNI